MAIVVEVLDPSSDRDVFTEWASDLLSASSSIEGADRVIVEVPASEYESAFELLEFWSGKDAVGVSFHGTQPPQYPTTDAIPGYSRLPFRDDANRTEWVSTKSISHPDPLGVKGASHFYGGSGWGITVEFDSETSKIVGTYTAANAGKKLAIVANGEILSAPVINEPFSSGCTISGDFTMNESRILALGLQEPPPVKYRVIK